MRQPNYAMHADGLQSALEAQFWNAGDMRSYQHVPVGPEDTFMYWWSAHAMDALLDGHLRTGDEIYLRRAERVLTGINANNKGTLINDYYDDMEWLALAMLRMWDVTKDPALLRRIPLLWMDIKTAWNDHMGGGMAWRKNQLDYKNTPANAPAAIHALRLYQRVGDESDLEWGRRIFEWNRDNLMDPETDYVFDGMNREGDGKIDLDWDFSYCQGTLIGAAVELYRITGEQEHLELAKRIARATEARVAQPNGGIMPYEVGDDCGLFRGIYVRYLAELSAECPDDTAIVGILAQNADSVIERGTSEGGLVGGDLTQAPAPGEPVDLAQHLSGVMSVEMAAKRAN